MMANYGHIILFSLIGGVFSLIGGIILLSKRSWADKLASYATPFAAGALLAAVFLDLLHEGISEAKPYTVLLSALIGMVAFFIAERFLRWFHHHHDDEDSMTDPTTSLVVLGDTIHNALDGIVIAASFLVSVPTGIITTIAVAAHEIPQEIGDFGLLLKKGMSRRGVILVNIFSALATVLMAVITFWLGSGDRLPLGVLLGLSAGFLLYIAASDIIPTIHDEAKDRLFDPRPFLLVAGVVVVGVVIQLAHQHIGVHDEKDSHKDGVHHSVDESDHDHDHDHDH